MANRLNLMIFSTKKKLSMDHLTFRCVSNKPDCQMFQSYAYKVLFLVNQHEQGEKDTAAAWTGSIFPDKNNKDHNDVLDRNATFFADSKALIYSLDELNKGSLERFSKSPQALFIRTDLLDACKKEDYNKVNDICGENGYGLLRVHQFENGVVFLWRQSIKLSKRDTTHWFWMQSSWKQDGIK